MQIGNRRIRVSSTYKRFILSFLIVLLLPVTCFVFIFLQNYREIYRNKIIDQARNSLEASAMELERTIEGLESFVSYNLMADSISDAVLLKDHSAKQIENILCAELIAQPVLEGISYYNPLKPDMIYNANGTFTLKYYYCNYISMDSEETLSRELSDPENAGWKVWHMAGLKSGESNAALQYVVRTWKDECWIFFISEEKLQQIISGEHSVTILQDSKGVKLYPFSPESEEESLNQVRFDGDEEGYCEIKVSSSNGSFMLIRYIDEDFLFEEMNAWQRFFFAAIMAVLLLGGVLILVLTSVNEQPIRKLQDDWRKKIPGIPENMVGLEALAFAMKSMEEQVLLTESKHKRNHLLLQMIYGISVQMILRIQDQFQTYIDSVRSNSGMQDIGSKTSVKPVGKVSKKSAKKEDTDRETHIISSVLAFIEENSHSCDLSVSMVSDHFKMSISNLSHQFKAQTNRTILDYITEKKFGYAGELLLTTDYSVQKIASMTGYSQTASFIRKFKQYYGMTPVEYRNTGVSKSTEIKEQDE